jgi:anti-anti-sigma factor
MADINITFQDLPLANGATAKHITFNGQLDETNVDNEAKKVYQVINEMMPPYLILDFSGLEYMNSKSIGYVTDWYTQAAGKQGAIAIVNPQPNILDILKVVGITQIMQVYPTLQEAQNTMGSAAAA